MDSLANAALIARITALAGELEQQSFPASALYVVATPIGNMGDISLRALKVLSLCSAIACEDTRKTGQLLARLNIDKSLLSAHQHNERDVAEKIIGRLQAGERIALVSDAGTPAISDPGARIVDAVITAGLRVIPIAGASAAVTALSVSGLIADQFHFVGFCRRATSNAKQYSVPCNLPKQPWCFTKPHTALRIPLQQWPAFSNPADRWSLGVSCPRFSNKYTVALYRRLRSG